MQLSFRSLPVDAVKKSFSQVRIGKSVHTLQEAIEAEQESADYIMFGNVFQTDSKQGLPGQGLERLEEMRNAVNIPVIAIGGITTENISTVLPHASGIAVLSAMWQASDRLDIVKKFHELLNEGGD